MKSPKGKQVNGMKHIITMAIALILVSMLLLGGYAQAASAAGSVPAVEPKAEPVAEPAAETEHFTDRELQQSYDTAAAAHITLKDNATVSDSKAVSVQGNAVTIQDEGVFVISGTLSDGCVIVDAEKTDKVELVLDNVNIASKSFAALYVRQADKVFVTLAEGSSNTLTNGGGFTQIDDNNVDGTVFAKDDLALKGAGSLTVTSPAGHGIVAKDELVVTGGSYTISAAKHGIQSKESVSICDAALNITAGKDGIKAEDSDAENVGDVYVESGELVITAGSDGISAGNSVTVSGGSIRIASDDSAQEVKGVKADACLTIEGGTLEISVSDDGLHSNGDLTVSGGSIRISSGDDALHADGAVAISDGSVTIEKSHEGIEGMTIVISGGDVAITADDDALNAAGGNDASGSAGPWSRNDFTAQENVGIMISGGKLTVSTKGDGLDSNGSLQITGGEIYVSGPVNGGNGSMDYNGSGTITGGIFAAAGNGQMAMNFDRSSTQCSMLLSVGSQKAGTEVKVTDAKGAVLLSWKPETDFQCVVISLPAFQVGETYTVTAGSYSSAVTFDSTLYGESSGFGGMGGMHGMGGDFPSDGGMRPDMSEMQPGDGEMQPGNGGMRPGGFGGKGGRR